MMRPIWQPPWHRRLRAALVKWSPLTILPDWEWDGWGEGGWHPTWRTRIAFPIMRCVRVLGAAGRCCVLSTRGSEIEEYPIWTRLGYRAKAIVCLVFGLRGNRTLEHYELDLVEVVWWNERRISYEYEEYDHDRVEVGCGWRNWYARMYIGAGLFSTGGYA